MKVELRIDPGCDGVSVVINAPALTDEVKALAARLEGGAVSYVSRRYVRKIKEALGL